MAISKDVKRWAFYGFANHSYQLVYIAFILPIFFANAFAKSHFALSAWGFATGFSTVLGITLAVTLGKYSDQHDKFKTYKFSITLTALGLFLMAIINTHSPSMLYWLFIVTNAVFVWSVALYDSILPHLSDNATVYEYGGFAWGFGYVGGAISLVIALLLQYITGNYSLWVFLSVPIFYIIFSLYSISGIKEISFKVREVEPTTLILSTKNKWALLLGYWLISECITVVGLFAAIYLSGEMHFTTIQTGIAFLIIQLIGFPATWYGGKLTKKFNSLSLLGTTIIGWGAALCALIFIHLGLLGLGIAVLLMGFVYGNSQSYIRSQYATLIKKSESGFQFGIYSFVSEAAVIIGPIVYGYASDRLHSQKLPLLWLFAFMVIGYGLVWMVTQKIKKVN